MILVAGEDEVATVVKPRLEDAGADLERILVVDRVEVAQPDFGSGEADDGTRGFSLENDLPAPDRPIEGESRDAAGGDRSARPRLGALDVTARAGRSTLDLLAATAAAHRVAIVAVTRLPNGPGARAFDRWLGSGELAAAARALWLVAKDRDDPGRRLLLPAKMNLCASPTGLAFRITQGASNGNAGRCG